MTSFELLFNHYKCIINCFCANVDIKTSIGYYVKWMCFYIKFISYILASNLSHIVAYNASLIRGHHNGWRGSRLNLTRSFHSDSYFKRVVCIAFFCHYLSVNFRTTVGLLLVSRFELFHSLHQLAIMNCSHYSSVVKRM